MSAGELLRLFAHQEQLADVVAAQALALATIPVEVTDVGTVEVTGVSSSTTDNVSTEYLVEKAASLRRQQRDMADWLERVANDARAQREALAAERQSLLESIAAANSRHGALATLTAELQATQQHVEGTLATLSGSGSASGRCVARDYHGASDAAGCGDDHDAGPTNRGGGHGSLGRGSSSSVDAAGALGADSNVMWLNVGGQRFCTTLGTLRAEESMLSTMFSGRFELKTDSSGAVFIDRDGTYFRHVLNYLRGAGLHLGKDVRAHLALREEADFYQIAGLQEMLRHELERLEDKGERLKQLAIDSAIEHTRGVFDELRSAIYAEVEAQAARGKRVVVIGFLQEKLVKGVRYKSQESDFWDAKILNPQYHRLLASIPNQQLMVDRLREDGLKAHVKPLSVNVPVGDEATAMQWVATTTLLLTLTIWEPTWTPSPVPGSASSAAGNSLGAEASHRLEASSGNLRPPTLLRSSSDLRSTDEWAEVTDVDSPSAPSERHISTVHRRTLNTAWGRPASSDDQPGEHTPG